MNNNYWKGQVVVITGASGGIGKSLALEAISHGAQVAVCARRLAKLHEVYADIPDHRILLQQCDVSDERQCEDFIKSAVDKFGGIDVLINNAGISMRANFSELDLSVLHQLMDINFWGTVNCTKYALDEILKSKGTICSVSSIAGYRGLPARTGYSASKFAMQGLMEALRTELLHSGANVMWVCPGFTASGIRDTALAKDGTSQKESPLDEKKLMSSEEVAHKILLAIEKRRRTLVLTTQGKFTVLLNKLWPSLTDKLVYRHFQKEKDSPIK